MKVSRKFRQMAAAYKHFALVWDNDNQKICLRLGIKPIKLDYSDQALLEMYVYETFGRRKYHEMFNTSSPSLLNAFYMGKQFLDISLASWLNDMPVLLKPWELYLSYPRWFLTRILPEKFRVSEETLNWVKSQIDTSFWTLVKF